MILNFYLSNVSFVDSHTLQNSIYKQQTRPIIDSYMQTILVKGVQKKNIKRDKAELNIDYRIKSH